MQRFFRLLAAASLTQVTFWTSYAFLPSELSGSMSYWGIVGSGSFVLIARHFAMVCCGCSPLRIFPRPIISFDTFLQHYVWEMDQISPVAFRIATHTFWGNKGPDRIVQIGTSQCQHTSRYSLCSLWLFYYSFLSCNGDYAYLDSLSFSHFYAISSVTSPRRSRVTPSITFLTSRKENSEVRMRKSRSSACFKD
jgi:hypothetical protein